MGDNTTPHDSSSYEREVARTIPFHAQLLEQAIDVALAVSPRPSRWLDTGCGPGRLVANARPRAEGTLFFLADPSAEMLGLAKTHNPDLEEGRFALAPSEGLPELAPFDVITAVQCHHYGDEAARERGVRRCRDLLRPSGVLVVFENVRAESDGGHALQRARWVAWLRAMGRRQAEAEAQVAREDTKFFPIRVSQHLTLLDRLGFTSVEVIWRAYGQAGFVARRR